MRSDDALLWKIKFEIGLNYKSQFFNISEKY